MKETWTKPPQDWSKVSFHVVIRNTFSTQAAVCRNHKGEIKHIITQVRPPCSQVNGEALAAKLATKLVSSMQLNKFILERESSIVISALHNSAFRLDSPFDHIIKDTLLSFSDSSLWKARKISINEIYAPIMWHIGLQQGFPRAAFPPHSPPSPSSIPICSGKDLLLISKACLLFWLAACCANKLFVVTGLLVCMACCLLS
jgi:hypothetical protein